MHASKISIKDLYKLCALSLWLNKWCLMGGGAKYTIKDVGIFLNQTINIHNS